MKTLARQWANVPKGIRESVIENLKFDAEDIAGTAPFGGGADEQYERARSEAFSLAVVLLEEIARTHATAEDEAIYVRQRTMDLEAELGAPQGPRAAGGGA